MKSESVKISKEILDKVRKHVGKTKQTIGGFIELSIIESLKKRQSSGAYIQDTQNP